MGQTPTPDNTFGAMFIGVILASVLYGVSCSQLLYYFENYSKKDGPAVKTVVVATWVSDTVHQVLICHTTYFYLVKGFFKPQQSGELVWSLLVEVLFNATTGLIVQSYFAFRIWKLSLENVPIAVVLAVFILGEFAAAIVFVVKSLPMATFVQLATLKPLSMTVNVLAATADVFITAVFCFLLHRAKSGLPNTNSMIDMLIGFSAQTGLMTSLCAIGSLISISVFPDTFIYICFYFMLGRLYCNSLLATLNIRGIIRKRANSDLGLSLFPTPDLNSPTAGNSHLDGRTRPGLWEGILRSSRQECSTNHPIQIEIHSSVSQHPTPDAELSERSSEEKILVKIPHTESSSNLEVSQITPDAH